MGHSISAKRGLGIQRNGFEHNVLSALGCHQADGLATQVQRHVTADWGLHRRCETVVRFDTLIRDPCPHFQRPVCGVVPIGLFGEGGTSLRTADAVQVEIC